MHSWVVCQASDYYSKVSLYHNWHRFCALFLVVDVIPKQLVSEGSETWNLSQGAQKHC
jgi:hypothetical protein